MCAEWCTAAAEDYFDVKVDGLRQSWSTSAWAYCNPPFSAAAAWAHKAILERRDGAHVLMLLPFVPGTRWFRGLFPHCCRVELIVPRLNYVDPVSWEVQKGVGFNSCLAWLKPGRVHPSSQQLELGYWEIREPKEKTK